MQRMADHLTTILPAGVDVIAIVVESRRDPGESHASLSTRTSVGLDVADLMRAFADDVDRKHVARDAERAASGAPDVGRIRADAPPGVVRRHLEAAVAAGANTVVLDPRALLRLMNASMS